MSVLVNGHTRVAIQGITGKFGSYHSQLMRNYGTQVVAGITPGKRGEDVGGIPVVNSVKEAVANYCVDTIGVLVPAPFVKDAVFEAIDAGIRLVVCLVEGVPVRDTMLVRRRLRESNTVMIGPNSPGIITPGECLVGFMPGDIYSPGIAGIVSRSGTFSYQVADSLTKVGIGQSTALGIGGDPLSGISFEDILGLMEADAGTEVIVMIGEIGRTAEEQAAAFIKERVTKPVFGMVLGATAPPGKQMGHAGAIVTRGLGTHESKTLALQRAGVTMAATADELAEKVAACLRASSALT